MKNTRLTCLFREIYTHSAPARSVYQNSPKSTPAESNDGASIPETEHGEAPLPKPQDGIDATQVAGAALNVLTLGTSGAIQKAVENYQATARADAEAQAQADLDAAATALAGNTDNAELVDAFTRAQLRLEALHVPAPSDKTPAAAAGASEAEGGKAKEKQAPKKAPKEKADPDVDFNRTNYYTYAYKKTEAQDANNPSKMTDAEIFKVLGREKFDSVADFTNAVRAKKISISAAYLNSKDPTHAVVKACVDKITGLTDRISKAKDFTDGKFDAQAFAIFTALIAAEKSPPVENVVGALPEVKLAQAENLPSAPPSGKQFLDMVTPAAAIVDGGKKITSEIEDAIRTGGGKIVKLDNGTLALLATNWSFNENTKKVEYRYLNSEGKWVLAETNRYNNLTKEPVFNNAAKAGDESEYAYRRLQSLERENIAKGHDKEVRNISQTAATKIDAYKSSGLAIKIPKNTPLTYRTNDGYDYTRQTDSEIDNRRISGKAGDYYEVVAPNGLVEYVKISAITDGAITKVTPTPATAVAKAK